jgi:SulP family sulfate permease
MSRTLLLPTAARGRLLVRAAPALGPSRVPALQVLIRYGSRVLRADLLAGLTVAAVAIPQAMADATVAGLPPQYGLWTAIVLTAVAALFSSSRHLVHGPTTAVTIALACTLAPLPVEEKPAAAVVLCLLVGLIQLACRWLRLADLGRHVSPAALFGFMLGIAAAMVLDQSRHVLGLPAEGVPGESVAARLWRMTTHPHAPNPWTLAIGLGTVVVVLLCKRLGQRLGMHLPEYLLALAVMATGVALCGLDRMGVRVVGEVHMAAPSLGLPAVTWERIRSLAPSALAIALLGLFESLAIARTLADRCGQRLDVRQQCLSDGLANLTGSFFGCFPGAGSFTRSTLNREAGAKTQWSAFFSAIAVALALLPLGPLVRFVPRAALAALLILSAWRLVDRRLLAQYLRRPGWSTAAVLATAAAVAISVEWAVLAGVVCSVAACLGRVVRPISGNGPGTPPSSGKHPGGFSAWPAHGLRRHSGGTPPAPPASSERQRSARPPRWERADRWHRG